jgi:uncharacterized damage-inducible protein DinB
MAAKDLGHYRYRGARALVLLQGRALSAFLPVWRRGYDAGVKLPETDDPNYASLQALLLHVLRAARGYMTWMCEKLGLEDPEIASAPDIEHVEREAERYLAHLLERWRHPLSIVEEKRFDEMHQTRWGGTLSIEAMLEHAVVHPMRHAFQIEELMER